MNSNIQIGFRDESWLIIIITHIKKMTVHDGVFQETTVTQRITYRYRLLPAQTNPLRHLQAHSFRNAIDLQQSHCLTVLHKPTFFTTFDTAFKCYIYHIRRAFITFRQITIYVSLGYTIPIISVDQIFFPKLIALKNTI